MVETLRRGSKFIKWDEVGAGAPAPPRLGDPLPPGGPSPARTPSQPGLALAPPHPRQAALRKLESPMVPAMGTLSSTPAPAPPLREMRLSTPGPRDFEPQ